MWVGADDTFVHRWAGLCYAKQALRLFREPLRTGRVGRPRLLLPEGVMIAQVIKRYKRRRVIDGGRHVVVGTETAVQERLMETRAIFDGADQHRLHVERLNATFRARLAPLARRTRAGVHERATLEAGMWLVGTCYNFLYWAHLSLRKERGGAQEPGGGMGLPRKSGRFPLRPPLPPPV